MRPEIYSFRVRWSSEDEAYIATAVEWPLLAAHGETPEDAMREIHAAVEGAIELCREDNHELPAPLASKSYSGKFLIRISEDLHRELAILAAAEGVSLNHMVTELLAGGKATHRVASELVSA